jgi:hypothetical protein
MTLWLVKVYVTHNIFEHNIEIKSQNIVVAFQNLFKLQVSIIIFYKKSSIHRQLDI